MLAAILSFGFFAALVTVTPGLDTLLVVRTAVTSGGAAAFRAALGIGLGCLVWAVASGLGLTALLHASSVAYTVVRWAGAGYLCLLGVRALWTAARDREPGPADPGVTDDGVMAEPDPAAGRGRAAAFRVGLTTNLLNPKIGVFYLAVLPQFLPSGVPTLPASLALATVHDVEGLLWFSLLILVVGRAARWLARPTVRRRLDVLASVAFIGFGLKVALSRG